MLKTCIRMTVFVCLAWLVATPAAAQTPAAPATGSLIVTVADQLRVMSGADGVETERHATVQNR